MNMNPTKIELLYMLLWSLRKASKAKTFVLRCSCFENLPHLFEMLKMAANKLYSTQKRTIHDKRKFLAEGKPNFNNIFNRDI